MLEHCGNQALVNVLRSLRDHVARFRNISLEMPEKVDSSHKAEIHLHFDHPAPFLGHPLAEGPQVTIAQGGR
jgi:hypothetical protein